MFWVGVAAATVAVGIVSLDVLLRRKTTPEIANIIEMVPPFSVRTPEPDPSAINVRFRTADHLELAGSWFLPNNPRGTIVFCHELLGNRWLAMKYCRPLLEAGFAVFSFDFRNHGESEHLHGYEPMHWASKYEAKDLRAALAVVRAHTVCGSLPLGLVGISRGGTVALHLAAEYPAVRAILADGAFSLRTMIPLYVRQWGAIYLPKWFIDGMPMWYLKWLVRSAARSSQTRKNCRFTNLERVLPSLGNRRLLLVSGRRDSYVKPAVTEKLAALIGPTCPAWIVKGAKHNKAHEIAAAEYSERMLRLFEENLEKPTR